MKLAELIKQASVPETDKAETDARSGLQALDDLLAQLRAKTTEAEFLSRANANLSMRLEAAEAANKRLQIERDWTIRHDAVVRATLTQLMKLMQQLADELNKPMPTATAEQIQQQLTPEESQHGVGQQPNVPSD